MDIDELINKVGEKELKTVLRQISDEFKWPISQFMVKDIPELKKAGKQRHLIKYFILMETLTCLLASCVIQIIDHLELNKFEILDFMGNLYKNFVDRVSSNLDKPFTIICKKKHSKAFSYWSDFSDN